MVALHPEGVDRNWNRATTKQRLKLSPSTRRAWIEIAKEKPALQTKRSPSTRRAWIEIVTKLLHNERVIVALHPEGVDRNA